MTSIKKTLSANRPLSCLRREARFSSNVPSDVTNTNFEATVILPLIYIERDVGPLENAVISKWVVTDSPKRGETKV